MNNSAQTPSTTRTLPPFRPPAVPLVTHDPYFSVWSMADTLTAEWTKHWTGKPQGLCGLLRIDGRTFRFLGPEPQDLPVLEQKGLDVLPTQTRYLLQGDGVALELTFFSPLLPDDLVLVSRPLTYILFQVYSLDQKPHQIEIYFDVTSEWAVDHPEQEVTWSRYQLEGETPLTLLRVGTLAQPVLAQAGDDRRIDWGYLYLGIPTPPAAATSTILGAAGELRPAFVRTGEIPAGDDLEMPRPVAIHGRNQRQPVLACVLKLGTVAAAPVERHLLLAYDDRFAISYFQRALPAYWRAPRAGSPVGAAARSLATMFVEAERDLPALRRRAAAFDAEVIRLATACGGEKYARLVSLAYRQCLAAHKLVADLDGTPLYFSKENFSNGCIATVDVTYPSAPFFLLYNPTLLKAMLTPVFAYAESPLWPYPWAPHDLGTYPLAHGQVYPEQMPVEECGNLLLLTAALTVAEGNASFAQAHWSTLTRWAEYLREHGFDPAEQLCTDDFAGHLARNANLSLKAILALAAYSRLAARLNEKETAARYWELAASMAARWQTLADAGDHYSLVFERPETWSLKYNLVWDRLLGLNLFPADVRRKEVAWYLARRNKYGTPLDSRATYTKGDWLVWAATLAETQEEFMELIEPLYTFIQESPSRVPFSDWHDTISGKQVGFQARSVVGGIFLPMLARVWQENGAHL